MAVDSCRRQQLAQSPSIMPTALSNFHGRFATSLSLDAIDQPMLFLCDLARPPALKLPLEGLRFTTTFLWLTQAPTLNCVDEVIDGLKNGWLGRRPIPIVF